VRRDRYGGATATLSSASPPIDARDGRTSATWSRRTHTSVTEYQASSVIAEHGLRVGEPPLRRTTPRIGR